MSLAQRNTLEVVPTDRDEPEYEGVTGTKLSVVSQTEMFIRFKTMKSTYVLKAILCADKADEIQVDLEMLLDWGIIPKYFPLHINAHDRVRSVKETNAVPKKMVDIKELVHGKLILSLLRFQRKILREIMR